jgi:hypothetical protein
MPNTSLPRGQYRFDDRITAGLPWVIDVEVFNDDNFPVDISGATIQTAISIGVRYRGRLVERVDELAPSISEMSTEIIDANDGVLRVSLTGEQTQAIADTGEDGVVYELNIVFPDNDILRLIEGTLFISPSILGGE